MYPKGVITVQCVYLCVYVCIPSDRKRGSWSLRACSISSGACGDQSGFRCRMTTSESDHPPRPRPGTQVAIWTVKGKRSRKIKLHLADRKWWYTAGHQGADIDYVLFVWWKVKLNLCHHFLWMYGGTSLPQIHDWLPQFVKSLDEPSICNGTKTKGKLCTHTTPPPVMDFGPSNLRSIFVNRLAAWFSAL